MSLAHSSSSAFARLALGDLDNGDPLVAQSAMPVYGVSIAARLHPVTSAIDFQPWPASLSLGSVDGTNGFKINGDYSGYAAGWSVTGGGDINGDGFSDVAVGAINASPNSIHYAGSVYVVFGNSTGVAPSVDETALNGNNGFRIHGISASDETGISVSVAGDINGDGFADLVIGAPYAYVNSNNEGAAYVVFGHPGRFSDIDLSTLDGVNGFKIIGPNANSLSHLGLSVSDAGDINGDGFDDIIIGANRVPNATYTGKAYVLFGSADGFAPTVDLSTLNGTNGFVVNGVAVHDDTGTTVAGIGDINGDGIDDLAIGAPNVTPSSPELDAGATYIVFGHTGAFSSSFDPTTLNGTNGFKLSGAAQYNSVGWSVANAGDVNGDGIQDIVVGALTFQKTGAAYVVFGSASGFPANLDVTSLNGTNGFRLTGVHLYDGTGDSVSSAGDINGDGFDDILVSASSADPNGMSMAGVTYVIFGKASGFAASIDLSTLDGTNGFVLTGEGTGDRSGQSVSAAGDLNNDGFADLIVGAPGNNDTGAAYVVYGRAPTSAVNLTGTDASQTLAGGNLNDVLNGMGGNDQLYGNGGHDTLTGGLGADTFHLSSANSADTDTITDYSASDGDVLDLTGLFDPSTAAAHLSDYVKFVTSGGDLTLQVDIDGTGSGFAFADVATLTGAAGQAPIVKVGNEVFQVGGGGNDHITGAATGDQIFDLSAGGDDSVTGGAGNDGFSFGASLTDLDFVNGGGGTNNQIAVQGDYSGGMLLTGSSIVNVQVLAMLPGFNYDFTTDDSFVTSGTFTFWAATMASGNHVHIDGSAEMDAKFAFYLGAGNDTAIGGNAGNVFYGGGGSDTLIGGSGADVFAYTVLSDSTGAAFDLIRNFDTSADKFRLPVSVGGIDAMISGGSLTQGSFDSDLAGLVNASNLAAHHAVLFHPTSGDYASDSVFLIVDANGSAGYQAGADFVFNVTGSDFSGLGTANFI